MTSANKNDDSQIIRRRIELYYGALIANKNSRFDVRDDMLMQFSREVADLRSQLARVEKSFGKHDAMARVLREALESAQCRLETRQIELALEKKAALAPKQKSSQSNPQGNIETPEEKKDFFVEWLLLAWLAIGGMGNGQNARPLLGRYGTNGQARLAHQFHSF